MIFKNEMRVLVFSLAGLIYVSSAEKGEEDSVVFEIQGKVPEGWEVVELIDAPMIEKWVELKNGEKKRILVKPFGLKPIVAEDAKFTVSNPLEVPSGQDIDEVLEGQNINLAQSEEELSVMLNRLKALLLTLPASIENKKES